MSLFDGVGRNPADVKDKLIESVQRERPGSHLCVDLGRSPLVQAGSRKYPFSLISWEPPVNQISPMGLCCLSPSSEFAAQTVRRTRKGRQMSWYRAGCALALAGFMASSCSVADNSNAASTHPTNSQSQSGHDPALSNDADGHHDAKPSGEGEFNSATTDAKFEFADWVPERGPADTSDPDFHVFAICDEIPETLVDAAGLTESEGSIGTFYTKSYTDCFYSISIENQHSENELRPEGSIRVSVDSGTEDKIREMGLLVDPLDQAKIPNVHFHQAPEGSECIVGIETIAGRINFGYDDIRTGSSFSDRCEIAYHYFSNMLIKSGGNNEPRNIV